MQKTKFLVNQGLSLSALVFLVWTVLQASCLSKEGKLTTEIAQKKLSQALDSSVVLLLPEGKIEDLFQLDMPMPSLKAARESAEVLKGLERESKTIHLLTSLAEEGFISFSYSFPRIVFDPKAKVQPLRAVYEIQVYLTEKGKEFQITEPPTDLSFSLPLKYFLLSPVHEEVFSEEFKGEFTVACLKLCEKEVGKVSRIRKTGKRSATVDFEWKYDRFTSLGEFISRNFEWMFQEGFFAVMTLRDGNLSRIVDLLDGKIITRDSTRFALDGGDWMVDQGKNP